MRLRDWRRFLSPWRAGGPAGYAARPDRFIGGNRIQLLRDGREAYPAMLEAVSRAETSVHLETYILRGDATGWRFAEAMAERARAGLDVRVIFDSVGSFELSGEFIQFLRNNGVRFLEYHPVAPWRSRWSWTKRDHRKLLIVDSKVGFAGGMNISGDHAPAEDGGGGWRDIDVRVEGPAAREMERIFRSVWHRETGRWFHSEAATPFRPGSSLIDVAANREFRDRQRIRRALIHAIERSRQRITAAIAYFIPDRGIRKALYDAAKRGVEVSILVPETSDIPAVDLAGRRLYAKHLSRGLRLFAWPGPVLHAKAMAVDRTWSSVGSYNITHRSLMHNLELNMHILDRAFAAELDDALGTDIGRSREILLSEWRGRPASEKLLEQLFFLLRYWF